MDITKLVRDPSKIRAQLKELPDGSVVCTSRMRIYVPQRFEERNLASISAEVYICGIYAIANDEGYYGISTVNAMMRISPTSINTIKINGDGYYEFTFEPGSTVIASTDLVKSDTLTYYIFDEIFAKGQVPWYIGYNDLGTIFETAGKHAGVSLSDNREVIELIASIISRNPDNRYLSYRHIVKDQTTVMTKPPAYISLDTIQYTATNTTAKLAGSYMAEGVVSALINPSTRVERIESILTK